MATINSQLSITNLGLESSSTASESENKSGFLAVFTSVQSEVQGKHAASNKENTEGDQSLLADNEIVSENPNDLGVVESSDAEPRVNSDSAVESDNVDDAPEQSDLTDTTANQPTQTETVLAQHSSGSVQRDNTTKAADTDTAPEKITPANDVKPTAKQRDTLPAETEVESGIVTKPTSNSTNSASSLLEQLTKSQSFDVGISTGSEETAQAQSVKAPFDNDSVADSNSVKEGAAKVKLTQNLVSLDTELAKLDKEGLEILKQFFTQLDKESEVSLGLSKHDLRLVMEKLNVAIAKAESKAATQPVTLQSVLATQPAKSNTAQQAVDQNVTPDDLVTESDNDQAQLQSTLASRPLGETVPVANKQQTITRPDVNVPHNVTAVAKAVAQEQKVDVVAQQTTVELTDQQATKTSPASVVSLSSHAVEKLQVSNEQTNSVKQSNVKVDTTQLVDEPNIETEASTEQPQSFAKLLNSLKANANTPMLSQLVSQIHASQLQQGEVSEASQHQLAMHTAQVMQNSKQTINSAEQVLQQPVNIAKSDAAKALFNKANMLLNLNLKEAEIRLDPPELGSMQIRIRSDAEQAQINFVVQSQQAKDVLEQSMGRLKEMLAEQGVNLGESSVSEQGQGERETAGHSGQESSPESEQPSANNGTEQIVSKQQDGIDFYA